MNGTAVIDPRYTVKIADTCTGVVLNARWILTTATCIRDGATSWPNVQYRTIEYATGAGTKATIVTNGMVQVYEHPHSQDFEGAEQVRHDVGLMYLVEAGIDLSGTGIIAGAPIQTDPRMPGQTGVPNDVRMAGWGTATTCAPGTNNTLRLSNLFHMLNWTGAGLVAEMNPAQACSADRGGPLLAPRGSMSLVPGLYSATIPIPGSSRIHFTKLLDSLDWIEETIANETPYPFATGVTNGTSNGYAYRRENTTGRGLGTIVSSLGNCLARTTDDHVITQACRGTAAQQWNYTVTGAITTADDFTRGQCLGSVLEGGVYVLEVASCNGTLNQRFHLEVPSDQLLRTTGAGGLLYDRGIGMRVTLGGFPMVWTFVD